MARRLPRQRLPAWADDATAAANKYLDERWEETRALLRLLMPAVIRVANCLLALNEEVPGETLRGCHEQHRELSPALSTNT